MKNAVEFLFSIGIGSAGVLAIGASVFYLLSGQIAGMVAAAVLAATCHEFAARRRG